MVRKSKVSSKAQETRFSRSACFVLATVDHESVFSTEDVL